MEIRQANAEDIPFITSIFRDTILNIESKAYSDKQLITWSSNADDIEQWKDRISNYYFIVAELDGKLIGFAYLKNGNYLDGIYVHKNYLRDGVGSKLLRIIESNVMTNNFNYIKSDVSANALAFFDTYYYEVIKKQKKNFKGLVFDNFCVEKQL